MKIFLCVICWMACLIADAHALRIGNLEFKDCFRLGEIELPLRGAGLKRFLTIQVVAVGLYVDPAVASDDILTDVPKSLEVIYLQNIPDSELRHATTKGIRLNVPRKEFLELSPRIDKINALYPNVRKMDRIRVTYLPGQGTIVEVNGEKKGVIAGADFGRAFFAIWVGDRPVDARMKRILLGADASGVEID